ncbi:flagellin N-terminal helical domain-containing protein [Aureimonas ureilytica]|uniref:flagellin N-terminal helical domain-containing protein n=1 Tax=Aureimonas ureilytica TaxID=401562 RepID=UPI00039B468B|nr:flagellin [Aureimonas ureilytica]
MTSVNTNAAALTALRTLQNTNSQLESVQSRISTGLKIGEAKDNAAYWSIATTLKSDNKSLSTVKDALSLGSATVDTAYQGLNKAKDVLDEIKSKLTAATQDGVDRSKIQSEITELQKQLTSIASSSTFSGENWLSVDSSVASYNATKSVVSSFSRDASGAVSIGSIDVNITNVKLFDKSGSADGILDGKSTLKKADGTTLMAGGLPGGTPPVTTALSFGNTPALASAGGSAGVASINLGTLDMTGVTQGDKLSFTLNVNGTSNLVRLDTTGLTAANFASKLQGAVNLALTGSASTAAPATVKVGGNVAGTSGAVTIETSAVGTSATISASAVTRTDGDGVTTSVGGLLTGGSLPAPKFGTEYEASASMQGTTATAFATPAASGSPTVVAVTLGTYANNAVTITDATDKVEFSLNFNGVPKTITADGFSAGTLAKADLILKLQDKIDQQFAGTFSQTNGRAYQAGDIVVSNTSGDTIDIKTKAGIVGSQESLQLGTVTKTNGFAASGGNAIAASSTSVVKGTGTGAGIVAGDTFSMDVQYGSTVKRITHTFQTVDFLAGGLVANWATKGQPTATEFAAFLQAKIDANTTGFGLSQFNGTGATYNQGDIKVVTDGAGHFSVETKKKGADMAVGISNVQATINGTASVAGTASATSRLGFAENSTSNYYASGVKTASTTGGVVGYGSATAPTQSIGTFDNTGIKNNDRISLTINNGGTQKTITISTDGMTGDTSTAGKLADAAIFKTRVQSALNDSVTGFGGAVLFDVDTGSSPTYAMTLKTVATGSQAYLAISNVQAQDGSGTDTAFAGLTAGAVSGTGTPSSTTSTAVLTSTANFAGPQTIGANDVISFNVVVDNVSKAVTIDRARVDAALPGQNGVIGSVTDYAAVLTSAFTAAGVQASVSTTGPSGALVITRTAAPASGSLLVTGLTAANGGNTMSVDKIDVSDAALTTAGVTSANRKDVFAAYISLVNDAINKVTTAAASLGSVASRIDMQKNFVNTLMDTIEKGVGNLVDADMTEESTKLQALQVKSQLGVQSLSIANQSAQSVLSLFRG